MIVVDASVLTHALVTAGPLGVLARERLSRDRGWTGPDHVLVETFSAIRGLERGRHLTQEQAGTALASLTSVEIDLVPTRRLLRRMWQLRSNMTGYDAAYVAVAEALGCALLTTDARWSAVPGVDCEIDVLSVSD